MLELVMVLIAMVAVAGCGCWRLLEAACHAVAPAWFGGMYEQAWEGQAFPGGGPPGRRLARAALARAVLARPAPGAQHWRFDGWSDPRHLRR